MPHATKSPAHLRCESLEDRDCPATAVVQFGAFLVVAGDANANNVLINDLGNGKLAIVADGKFSLKPNVRTVVIATGSGDDTVNYKLFGSASAANLVAISTGVGNDNITVNASSLSDSVTLGVNGGSGDDEIGVTLGGVPLGQTVNLFLSGGSGADTFDVNASGEVDGLLNVRVNGGGGLDTSAATSAWPPAAPGRSTSSSPVRLGTTSSI
jgi:hypothetical protein